MVEKSNLKGHQSVRGQCRAIAVGRDGDPNTGKKKSKKRVLMKVHRKPTKERGPNREKKREWLNSLG